MKWLNLFLKFLSAAVENQTQKLSQIQLLLRPLLLLQLYLQLTLELKKKEVTARGCRHRHRLCSIGRKGQKKIIMCKQ